MGRKRKAGPRGRTPVGYRVSGDQFHAAHLQHVRCSNGRREAQRHRTPSWRAWHFAVHASSERCRQYCRRRRLRFDVAAGQKRGNGEGYGRTLEAMEETGVRKTREGTTSAKRTSCSPFHLLFTASRRLQAQLVWPEPERPSPRASAVAAPAAS